MIGSAAVIEKPAVAAGFSSITDSFNRANSTTTMGNTDTGQTWVPNSGTWGISSNQAYLVSATSQATTVFESTVADISLQLTAAVAGNAGPCWRSTDDNNNYLWFANSGLNSYVYKRLARSFTALVGPIAALANGDVMKLVASGSGHTLTINGGAFASFTDSFNSTATSMGCVPTATTRPASTRCL